MIASWSLGPTYAFLCRPLSSTDKHTEYGTMCAHSACKGCERQSYTALQLKSFQLSQHHGIPTACISYCSFGSWFSRKISRGRCRAAPWPNRCASKDKIYVHCVKYRAQYRYFWLLGEDLLTGCLYCISVVSGILWLCASKKWIYPPSKPLSPFFKESPVPYSVIPSYGSSRRRWIGINQLSHHAEPWPCIYLISPSDDFSYRTTLHVYSDFSAG